jgi:hypothetical protein
MAQTYDTFWQKQFAKAIEGQIQHTAGIICGGLLSNDEYKLAAGRITGLRAALDLIDEVNDEIRKAEAGERK